MVYPYQIVTFFDRIPAVGEYIYNPDNWYPQVALKRRFTLADEHDEAWLLEQLNEFAARQKPLKVTFGEPTRPAGMPVDVLGVTDQSATKFHNDVLEFLGENIESKFPVREGANYRPHMTIEWQDQRAVSAGDFAKKSFEVKEFWLVKDQDIDAGTVALQGFKFGDNV
jgi:hypothetical protein